MGGVGIATPQFWNLNNQNPALLVYNSLTIFGAGVVYESRGVKGDTTNEKSKGGNLNYLVMAFPIRPRDVTKQLRWTTSLGLMPFSNVQYKLQYTEPVGNAPTEQSSVSQEGSGGLSKFYWANGYRLTKGFSLGLRASYIFGSTINSYSNSLVQTAQPIRYIVDISEKNTVHDFSFQMGFAYTKDSVGSNNNRFSVGGTYGLAAHLNGRQKVVFSRLDYNNPDRVLDSSTVNSKNGQLFVPADLGLGVSYGKDQKWMLAIDFTYQDWSKFQGLISEESQGLASSWRVAMGGEYTPDAYSVDSFLKRISYRAGASYEKSPYVVNNNAVKDFGINFGLSVPTGRSSIDLAFRVGKRGNISQNILEENYFKVYFGLTLNDQWFVKRKFD